MCCICNQFLKADAIPAASKHVVLNVNMLIIELPRGTLDIRYLF